MAPVNHRCSTMAGFLQNTTLHPLHAFHSSTETPLDLSRRTQQPRTEEERRSLPVAYISQVPPLAAYIPDGQRLVYVPQPLHPAYDRIITNGIWNHNHQQGFLANQNQSVKIEATSPSGNSSSYASDTYSPSISISPNVTGTTKPKPAVKRLNKKSPSVPVRKEDLNEQDRAKYLEKRAKNNEAAKRSRDLKRDREQEKDRELQRLRLQNQELKSLLQVCQCSCRHLVN